jgi:hypothetical protein
MEQHCTRLKSLSAPLCEPDTSHSHIPSWLIPINQRKFRAVKTYHDTCPGRSFDICPPKYTVRDWILSSIYNLWSVPKNYVLIRTSVCMRYVSRSGSAVGLSSKVSYCRRICNFTLKQHTKHNVLLCTLSVSILNFTHIAQIVHRLSSSNRKIRSILHSHHVFIPNYAAPAWLVSMSAMLVLHSVGNWKISSWGGLQKGNAHWRCVKISHLAPNLKWHTQQDDFVTWYEPSRWVNVHKRLINIRLP